MWCTASSCKVFVYRIPMWTGVLILDECRVVYPSRGCSFHSGTTINTSTFYLAIQENDKRSFKCTVVRYPLSMCLGLTKRFWEMMLLVWDNTDIIPQWYTRILFLWTWLSYALTAHEGCIHTARLRPILVSSIRTSACSSMAWICKALKKQPAINFKYIT